MSDASPPVIPVQHPLSLVLQLKPGITPQQYATLDKLFPKDFAGKDVQILHFAWTVPLDDKGKLLLSTVYDRDFEPYLDFFIDRLGDFFNYLMPLVEGGSPTPVADHRKEFYTFIKSHDLTHGGKVNLFSAYPQAQVPDILQALGG